MNAQPQRNASDPTAPQPAPLRDRLQNASRRSLQIAAPLSAKEPRVLLRARGLV